VIERLSSAIVLIIIVVRLVELGKVEVIALYSREDAEEVGHTGLVYLEETLSVGVAYPADIESIDTLVIIHVKVPKRQHKLPGCCLAPGMDFYFHRFKT
jgi:hypothetical protein